MDAIQFIKILVDPTMSRNMKLIEDAIDNIRDATGIPRLLERVLDNVYTTRAAIYTCKRLLKDVKKHVNAAISIRSTKEIASLEKVISSICSIMLKIYTSKNVTLSDRVDIMVAMSDIMTFVVDRKIAYSAPLHTMKEMLDIYPCIIYTTWLYVHEAVLPAAMRELPNRIFEKHILTTSRAKMVTESPAEPGVLIEINNNDFYRTPMSDRLGVYSDVYAFVELLRDDINGCWGHCVVDEVITDHEAVIMDLKRTYDMCYMEAAKYMGFTP